MVSDGWTTIGEISEVFDGPHATPKKIDKGPYFLSISSLENGSLDLSKSAHLSEADFKKWTRRVTPKYEDILFSYETRLGEAALMPEGIKACLGRRMGLLRPDIDKVFPQYLLFAYLSPQFQEEIRKRTNYGATVERIALKELPSFPIKIPPLPEQKAIAHILGSLDDKIELNRQMNETLEAMAQALFKSWFVDFDPVIDNALAASNAIPDEFIERAEQRKGVEKKDHSDIQDLFPDEFEFTEEMGWIPKGWKISTLGQESGFSNGYAFKSKELTEESKDAFHVFKMGHIKRGGGFNADGTKSYFPIADSKDLERYLLRKGDLLMAMTDMKSSMALLGHTALMPENDKFLVNQRVGRLSVKEDATLNYPYIYIYSNLDSTITELRSRANSGVQVNLSTAEIKATNILVPSKSVHDIFDVKAVGFFEKTFLNDQLNRKLAETRDTLLPRLMSGELRISDAAALVDEAI